MYQASRFGARVFLLLAAAAAASAADLEPAIAAATWLPAWLHLKLQHFIFGAIGAALMVSRKPLGWGQTFATLFSGVGLAIIATPLALDQWGLKPATEHALAALLGASGLYVMNGAELALKKFSENPVETFFAWLDRWRGRTPPPVAGDRQEAPK